MTTRTPPSPQQPSVLSQYTRAEQAAAHVHKAKQAVELSRNLKTEFKTQILKSLKELQKIIKDQEEEIEITKSFGVGPDPFGQEMYSTPGQAAGLVEQNIMYGTEEIKILTGKFEEHTKHIENKIQAVQEELKKLNNTIESNIRSYASVASEKPKLSRPPALQSIVVTSQSKEETGEEILNKIRSKLDAKSGWIKIEKIRKAKDQKVIMGFQNSEERNKAKNKLTERGSGLVVEEVKNKDPLVVLRGVTADHSDEDILSALRNQNGDLFDGLGHGDDRLSVKYRKKTRNPQAVHVVLSASPALWSRMTGTGIVRVDHQRVRAEDQSPLVQCTRCLGYGHGKKFCKEKADLCSHCGEQHLSGRCAKRQQGVPPTCRNCNNAKLEKADHNAFSDSCPIRRKWDDLARSTVAYC